MDDKKPSNLLSGKALGPSHLALSGSGCDSKNKPAIPTAIPNNGSPATAFFHCSEPEHINHKVVVPHAGAAFAQYNFFVTAFFKLFDNIFHLPWA